MWARFSSALRSTSSRHGLEDSSQQQEQVQVQEQEKGQEQEQERLSLNSLTTMSKQGLGFQTRTFGFDMTNSAGYHHHHHHHHNEDAVSNSNSRQGSMDMDVTMMNQSHTEVMNILTDMSDVNHDSSQDGHGAGASDNDSDNGFSRKPQMILPPLPPIPSSFIQPVFPPPFSPPSRRALFKRGNYHNKDPDSVRGYSGSLKLLPKKIRGSLPFGIGPQQPSCTYVYIYVCNIFFDLTLLSTPNQRHGCQCQVQQPNMSLVSRKNRFVRLGITIELNDPNLLPLLLLRKIEPMGLFDRFYVIRKHLEQDRTYGSFQTTPSK